MSAGKLAELVDVKRQTISLIENDKVLEPRQSTIQAIAKALEVTEADIAMPKSNLQSDPDCQERVKKLEARIQQLEDDLRAERAWSREMLGQAYLGKKPERIATQSPNVLPHLMREQNIRQYASV